MFQKTIFGLLCASSLLFSADYYNQNRAAPHRGQSSGYDGAGLGGCNAAYATLPRMVVSQLSLTRPQQEKLARIVKKYATKIAMAPKECDIKPLGFIDSYGDFDRNSFISKQEEAASIMANLKADMFEESVSILNPKQKEELQALLSYQN